MLNGEIISFIESISFTSKKDLLATLRTMRENTVRLSVKDRRIVKEMIGIAIQQVFHTPEKTLLQFTKGKL